LRILFVERHCFDSDVIRRLALWFGCDVEIDFLLGVGCVLILSSVHTCTDDIPGAA
ncbi:unnamed protein product, partial [Rotaria sp. Silwood2]